MTILHIDSSARKTGSATRDLTAAIVAKFGGDVIRRDVTDTLPHVSEDWIGANFTPADQRDPVQQDILSLSDTLVAEIQSADTLVIGVPVYNFGLPASLKAWIDMVCRAGLTFKYTETGPQGLMSGKRAIIVVASGGTEIGSPIDFATPFLRHVLGFIGITDVQIVSAGQQMVVGDKAMSDALAQIEALAA